VRLTESCFCLSRLFLFIPVKDFGVLAWTMIVLCVSENLHCNRLFWISEFLFAFTHRTLRFKNGGAHHKTACLNGWIHRSLIKGCISSLQKNKIDTLASNICV
jgi:hypothetical protein